jgi:hypothetical protein
MSNFKDLTVNIRSAFRLLLSFVKTFKGIVQFIGDSFGLSFGGDKQLWGTPPQNDKRNLKNKDLWDWFPMYYHAYQFEKQRPVISFSIILQCDTGYWDAWKEEGEIYDYIDQYADVAVAKTKIIFGLCNGRDIDVAERFNDYTWNSNLGTDDWKMATKDAKSEFSIPATDKGEKKIYFKVYDISDFKDQETAVQSLRQFVSYLKQNNIENFELEKDS